MLMKKAAVNQANDCILKRVNTINEAIVVNLAAFSPEILNIELLVQPWSVKFYILRGPLH